MRHAFNLVLTKEFVEDAVKILVTRFIPLNPSDLEEWMADPEEWVNAEEKENDQWEYELRVCSYYTLYKFGIDGNFSSLAESVFS